MRDDDDNDIDEIDDVIDVETFDDPVSQRALAFVALARAAESLSEGKTKELTHIMMRRVILTIKTQPQGQLVALQGGKNQS